MKNERRERCERRERRERCERRERERESDVDVNVDGNVKNDRERESESGAKQIILGLDCNNTWFRNMNTLCLCLTGRFTFILCQFIFPMCLLKVLKRRICWRLR